MAAITCVLPRICDFNGNLDQDWYIEYRFYNPEKGKRERIKVYKGINIHHNETDRRIAAKRLCDEWTAKLQSGYNPFDRKDVIYDSHLIYERDEWKGRAKTKDYTIEYYLNQVLDQKKQLQLRGNLADKTFQAYLTKARSLVEFLNKRKWQNIPIQYFTIDHARVYMESIWSHVNHNHTWNIYLITLRMMWKELAKLHPKLMLNNPWDDVDLLRYESTPAKAFNTNQIEKIRNHLTEHDPYLLMICEVIYYCFIRPCKELTGLQVKDIDFDHNCFIVPGLISKNNKTQPVKIPKQLMDKLKAMRVSTYPENYHLFTRFSEPHAQRSGRDYFSKRFKKVMVLLGFGEGYTIYSWKHTGNRRLAESDIPLKFAQLQNRHHSLDQTATYQQSLSLSNNQRLYEEFPEM